jgi:uncharacterized CHY-type Zn-finger protein
MSKKEKFLHQIALQNKAIADAGVNIVTCGHCGEIILTDIYAEVIECPHCNSVMEHCDCPDLYYTGMELK